MCNALSLKVTDLMSKVLFVLVGTKALGSEAGLILHERLPGLEDLQDCFRRFIGNRICPTIASEVVGEAVVPTLALRHG